MIAESAQLAVYVGVALEVSWQMTLGGLLTGGFRALNAHAHWQWCGPGGKNNENFSIQSAARAGDGLGGFKPLKGHRCRARIRVGPLLESEIRGLNKARRKQILKHRSGQGTG